jgi:hypothetical protein
VHGLLRGKFPRTGFALRRGEASRIVAVVGNGGGPNNRSISIAV